MQTIIQLSSDSRGMILMLLFFLLLVQLFEFLLAVFLHIYGRHVMGEGLFAVICTGMQCAPFYGFRGEILEI